MFQPTPNEYTRVAIKVKYNKLLPFPGLQSRVVVATVFCFFGDQGQVGDFMQKASHKTRAYYDNSDRLKGFLVAYPVSTILQRVHETEELASIT